MVTFDQLVDRVRTGLSRLEDPRNRSMGYSFADITMAGFAVFSLKYPSLLCFDDQTATQGQNLMTLFGIEQLCSDSHLRKMLDEVDPSKLRLVFSSFYDYLNQLGITKSYRVLGNRLVCTVDGVHHYSWEKVFCERCLRKVHRKRISISGVKEKLSLIQEKNKLRLTKPKEQGTHILKPIPRDLKQVNLVPANKHLTMQIADQVYQIPTAKSGLVFFQNGDPAYLTRRFDIRPDRQKWRVEDFASLAGRSLA